MVRRGVYILLLVSLLAGAILAGHWGLFPLHSTRLGEFAAVVVALAAGGVGLLGMIALHRRCNAMAASIRQLTQEQRLIQIQCPDRDLVPLSAAINDLIGYANQSISKSALASKEMEIRMKVAFAERQHAEAIIYSISDAVLVTDSFDELVLANESAARAFEFDLRQADRAPVGQVLRDSKLLSLIREMRLSNSRSERRIVEHQVTTPSGGRTYKVTLSCVADRKAVAAATAATTAIAETAATPQSAGVVAVLHDMTKEKEVAQMKNDFVSNVSHELRTPLASIKAYVEMLIDGEADDERTKIEFYEVIQNEANRLSRLIDDILNISRIESGLIKVNKQPQSLAVIISEAIEVITPQAKQKSIVIDEGTTPTFYQALADKDMLYQAVLNLLSNAVKYTPEGGTITVRTTFDESKRLIVTRINDTGVGIPARDLPFVFEKFFRAEANNRMAKGTGLGLSLVKQIIETVHGGKVFVESTVGKGSSFGFELKLAE